MIPTADHVVRLLKGLLGRSVQGKVVKSVAASAQSLLYWGLYVDPNLQIRWACSCDLALAANAAAALSVFPVGRAQENIKAGKLEPALEENLREVLNILAQPLNVSGQVHLRYDRMLTQKGQVPAEIRPGLQTAKISADFDLSITGYGGGRLSFVQMSALPTGNAGNLSVAAEI